MNNLRSAVKNFIDRQKNLVLTLSSVYQTAKELFNKPEHKAYFQPYENIFEVIGLEDTLKKDYFPHAGLLDEEAIPESITSSQAIEIIINIFTKKSFEIIHNNCILAFSQLRETSEILGQEKIKIATQLGSVNLLTRYGLLAEHLESAKSEIKENLFEFVSLIDFIKNFSKKTLEYSVSLQEFLENPTEAISELQVKQQGLKNLFIIDLPELSKHLAPEKQTLETGSSPLAWKRAVRTNNVEILQQLFDAGLNPEKTTYYIFPTHADGTIKQGEVSPEIRNCVMEASRKALANTPITPSSSSGHSHRRKRENNAEEASSSHTQRPLPPSTKTPPASDKTGINIAPKKYATNSLKLFAEQKPISGPEGLINMFGPKLGTKPPTPGF